MCVARTDLPPPPSQVMLVTISVVILIGSLLFIVFVVIYTMATVLTKPLQWMEKIANRITDNAGSDLSSGIDVNEDPFFPHSPVTEITALVREFKVMIISFGGGGAAKAATVAITEARNPFEIDLQAVEKIYTPGLPHRHSTAASVKHKPTAPSAKIYPDAESGRWVNAGKLSKVAVPELTTSGRVVQPTFAHSQSLFKSPLFLWVVFSIVTPLVLVLVGTSFFVSFTIKSELPGWLEDVEAASVALEKDSVETTVTLRAGLAKEIMEQPVRDLHLYSRVAGWLYFGALERSDSFTKVETGATECLASSTCAFQADWVCDCDWLDSHNSPNPMPTCDAVSDGKMKSRGGQFQSFSVEFDSETSDASGGRMTTSGGTTEEGTKWHTHDDLPGKEKGAAATGYETLYDRVRVYSALSVVEFPMYNYDESPDYSKQQGSYIGFEQDGLFIGYAGCDAKILSEPWTWKSSKDNRSPQLRPELCPQNKVGYDPRCR